MHPNLSNSSPEGPDDGIEPVRHFKLEHVHVHFVGGCVDVGDLISGQLELSKLSNMDT